MKRNQLVTGIFAAVSLAAALFILFANDHPVQEPIQKLLPSDETQTKVDLPAENSAKAGLEFDLSNGQNPSGSWSREFDLSDNSSADEIAAVELYMPVLNSRDNEKDDEIHNAPVFLQWQYLPTADGYIHPHEKMVRGLAIGYYLPQHEITGVSLAVCHLYNTKKSGFSASLLDICADANGLAIFLVGGAVINRGCSLGLWNMTENNQGLQIGIFNREEDDLLMDYSLKPSNKKDTFGVQAGIVNYSDSKGIQFGLWNINPNGFLPYFPVFNICF